MKRFYRIAAAAGAFLVVGSASAVSAAGVVEQEQVLSYLEQVIGWQRDTASIEPAYVGPREVMFQDAVQQNGLRAVRAAFKFARGQASIAPAETLALTGEDAQHTASRHAALEAQVAQLREQLSNARGVQRQQLEGELKLALAQQELLDTIQANFNAAASGGGMGFSAKIGNLQRSVPEMLEENPAPASAEGDSKLSHTPSSATGLLSLSGSLFTIARKQRELKELISHSEQLETHGREMLEHLRAELDGLAAPDAAGSVVQRLADFKQIAGVVAPLAETNVWITSGKNALKDWDRSLGGQFLTVLRQFGLRVLVLAMTLAIPLVLGEVAERAINRYLADPKRLRQAHTARRLLVGIAVFFILLMNFISDFTSFVTFAGFITAGLAVALQGVLLSLVAHFFFYGRNGVRAGDRVTVAGVTGDIVQVGMVRFYMRELRKNDEGTLEPTGKMVALPNSVLFQPSAFYKHT